MSRGSTPRRPETRVSLCNLMLKCGILRSSAILGSDCPQSNNRKGNIHSRERPNFINHAIAGYLRPTPAPALPPLLSGGPGNATGNPPEDYGQIRGGCSCP